MIALLLPLLLGLSVPHDTQGVLTGSSARVLLEAPGGAVETRALAGFDTADPRALGAWIVRFEGLPALPAAAASEDAAEIELESGDRLYGRVRGGRAELLDLELIGG